MGAREIPRDSLHGSNTSRALDDPSWLSLQTKSGLVNPGDEIEEGYI